MTVLEIKQFLKNQKIKYEDFAAIANIPVDTLKNILTERTKRPRIDTMQAIEEGIDKIKISNGELPLDIEEYERMTRGNDIARRISELPPEKQDDLFALLDKAIELAKK